MLVTKHAHNSKRDIQLLLNSQSVCEKLGIHSHSSYFNLMIKKIINWRLDTKNIISSDKF